MGYRVYNLDVFYSALYQNEPFSGFVTQNNEFAICCHKPLRSKDQKHLYILQHKNFTKTKNGMSYHIWSFDNTQTPLSINEQYTPKSYVLFLPELCKDGFHVEQHKRCVYTVIDEEWRFIDNNCEFSWPRVGRWDN